MKLAKIFENQVIPDTKHVLKREEEILFKLETIKDIYGDKNGLQSIISKQQQSVYILKQRLSEYEIFIKRILK